LREDKGYTYGVYSNLEPMRYDGYFNVSTEVAKGAASDAVGEIYKEFERLREKPVGDEELLMVRNYLLGYLLTGLDGPFNVSEMVKMVAIDDLDINFFDNMVQTIKTITPNEIQALANKYLKRENMYEVVVG
jgi:zinc protease